jgi:AmmeMemoRadiSam system protein B
MVGYTSTALETAFGNILAPYLADESNAFVISSDFCHWGTRFSYTYYVPRAPAPGPVLPLSSAELPQPLLSSADTERKLMSEDDAKRAVDAVAGGQMLRAKERIAKGAGIPAIHESISACDIACMAAIASGRMRSFRDALQRTGNTVCGRHPIGVIMAAMEVVMGGSTIGDEDGSHGAIPSGRFNFVRYERSSDAVAVSDSSVSYVSAFAVL